MHSSTGASDIDSLGVVWGALLCLGNLYKSLALAVPYVEHSTALTTASTQDSVALQERCVRLLLTANHRLQ